MYTRKYIDVITLAIVALIFILMNIYHLKNQSNIQKIMEHENILQVAEEAPKEENNQINTFSNNNLKDEYFVEENTDAIAVEAVPKDSFPEDWYIEIPRIDLIAKIHQGTDEETLNKYVGHFEESPVLKGNICLAAHNRGYDVNYFEKLKTLQVNDIIIYQYGDKQKIYVVTNMIVIKEDDWSYIKNESKNQLTLITCIENEPTYRLCVQAQEI